MEAFSQEGFVKMIDINQLSGRQIAAARALIGLGQVELAERAGISAPTLRRMEASSSPIGGIPNNVRAVVAALQAAGCTFLPDDGEHGSGVRAKESES